MDFLLAHFTFGIGEGEDFYYDSDLGFVVELNDKASGERESCRSDSNVFVQTFVG